MSNVLRPAFFISSAALSFSATLFLWAQTPQAPPPGAVASPGGARTERQGAPPAGRGATSGQGRGSAAEPDFSAKPPVVALTPEEQAKKFWLPPGFKMELVLSDPDIAEPAQIAFDGNGRMYVLELLSYMQDAEGSGTLDPVSRISLHEDRDNDGKYETHHVVVDKLVFPRFVTPFGPNTILAKESNADEVWKYTDTNGDFKADKKELFATGFGRLLNVEHQEGGLMWAMDNWLYSTINLVRLRWTPNGVLREPTGSNAGQWSVTQDNYGKTWFQGGGSGMPGYFQTPVVYGNFRYPQEFAPDLNITWGAPVLIADMQGGMGAVRMPDGSLARATSAAGNDVFRGDRLPKDMIGDYFYGEAVARIIRRLRPVPQEGLTQLRNVYPLSEFIRSTDPLFRPVDITTAPDGTMYITDMYRGIIQESQWSGPGTYLRQRINQYQLDRVVRHGRIWRLTYEGMPRRKDQPRMNEETPSQLVAHLSDPNGWWRDTAQQLLVLKQDTSVVAALKELARSSTNQLARIHALWTLEGLNGLDKPFAQLMMKDRNPQIRLQAIRASETLYKAGDRSIAADWKNLTRDADVNVVMQAMMTLNVLKVADANVAIKSAMDTNPGKGVQVVASTILTPPTGPAQCASCEAASYFEAIAAYSPEEQQSIKKGEQIYKEICFSCHGDDGLGAPSPGEAGPRAPALAASPRVLGHHDYVIKTLLHGLTGPIAGKTYTEVMIPLGQNNDEWIAAIASYVRNAFGNRASVIDPVEVARVRAASAGRKTLWSTADLDASLPKLIPVDPSWKVTASHNAAIASYALTIQPWTSGERQSQGMWLQLELQQPLTLTEIQFESSGAQVITEPIKPGAPRTSIRPKPADAGIGYPRAYQVQVSADGTNWGQPVAQGKGTGRSTTITFAPVRAKFIRITQTASEPDAPPLSIQKLRLYEPSK